MSEPKTKFSSNFNYDREIFSEMAQEDDSLQLFPQQRSLKAVQ